MKNGSRSVTIIMIAFLSFLYLPGVPVLSYGGTDSDGVSDLTDNCIYIPNGPDLGTCVNSDKAPIPCQSDRDCPLPPLAGLCQLDQEDADNDGMGDVCDSCPLAHVDYDRDGDCVEDKDDGCPDDPDKSDPGFCGCDIPETDTDGDTTPDCVDGCPDDPGKTEVGVCGCGTPDLDFDQDGAMNCIDDCPYDSSKTEPEVCGCGSVEFEGDSCSGTPKLPDTGQWKCYDNAFELPSCPSPGGSFYGQDANYQINPPHFTKLNSFGSVLPDEGHSWSMVRDNVTGLVWHVKGISDGSPYDRDIHDPDNTYLYCRSPYKGESFPDLCGKDYIAVGDTQEYVDMLNLENAEQGFGFRQWRMPTVKELVTLMQAVDSEHGDPDHLFPGYLSNSLPGMFWTSTESDSRADPGVWTLNFGTAAGSGEIEIQSTNIPLYAIAVSGDRTNSYDRYVSNIDGTVTDRSTGLMWVVEPADEDYDGLADDKTIEEALAWAEGLDHAGYYDWRLPNRNELLSLVDYNRSLPAYDNAYFPGVHDDGTNPQLRFWSSTTTVVDGSSVQGVVVEFATGTSNSTFKNQRYNARAVRGGQQESRGKINIAYPVQGDFLSFGGLLQESMRTIKWNPGALPESEDVKIYFSRDGGQTYELISEWFAIVDGHYITGESVVNNGEHSWTLTGPDSVNCLVKIVPEDPAYESLAATSGLFSIRDMEPTDRISYWYHDSDPGYYFLYLRASHADGLAVEQANWIVTDGSSIGQVNSSSGRLTNLSSLNGWVQVSTGFLGANNLTRYLFFAPDELSAESEDDSNNDNSNNPDELRDGSFHTGELGSSDDIDYFSFNLGIDTNVNIGFLYRYTCTGYPCPPVPHTDLEVISDASGETIASVPADKFTIQSLGLEAGLYNVKLTAGSDFTSYGGYYIISYMEDGSIPYGANPSIPTELTLGMNPPNEGVINHLDDMAQYSFRVSEPSAVELHFAPSSDSATYHIEILDNNNQIVAEIDVLSGLPVDLGGHFTDEDGPYTIIVSAYDAVDAINPFYIQVAHSDEVFETEPNDTREYADSLILDIPVKARMNEADDEDYFSFTLDAPSYLNLFLFTPGSSKDYTMTIFKGSTHEEIDEINTPAGNNVSLHTGLTPGTYFVRIKALGEAETTQYYTLLLQPSMRTSLELEANDSFLFANTIEEDTPRTGRIYAVDDIDYYGFGVTLNPGETTDIEVSFESYSAEADYHVSLLDVNREEVVPAQDSNNGLPNPLVLNGTVSTGNYYVKVEYDADDQGSAGDIDPFTHYELTVTSSDSSIVGRKNIAAIKITGTADPMLPAETTSLEATAIYSDSTPGSHLSSTFTWESLDPTVATVNVEPGGEVVVSSLAEGKTTIIASLPAVSDKIGKFVVNVGSVASDLQHHGSLILVAGGGDNVDDTLYEATRYMSELVYRRFKSRLFEHEDIYFFAPRNDRDLDGDGNMDTALVDDQDFYPTRADLEYAISDWAVTQQTDGPLHLYMIDHGGTDNFKINSNGEYISSQQLKELLDDFQTLTGRTVIVYIEACKSGSFIDGEAAGNLIATDHNRAVITSTDLEDTHTGPGGSISFTQFLVDGLWVNRTISEAYDNAVTMLQNSGPPFTSMSPQLGLGNGSDAGQVRVGGNFTRGSLFPEFRSVFVANQEISANTMQSFFADIVDLGAIERVWALVRGPDFQVPEISSDFEAPEFNLEVVEYQYDQADGSNYEGQTNKFKYNGNYSVTCYAMNDNGNVTMSDQPLQISVTGGLLLSGDINGDLDVTLSDGILALRGSAGFTTTGIVDNYPDSGADVNNDMKLGLAEAIMILEHVAH